MNSESKKIRVLLVDDSPLALTILKRMLSSAPDIEVVGMATNGEEALALIPQLQPAVICTDLHMPVMDGLQLTKEVMAKYPRPILVISVSVEEGSSNVFRLLEAGAIDVFQKPRSGLELESQRLASELIRKIKILAGVHVFRKFPRERPATALTPEVQPCLEIPTPVRIVIIGASTGGPQALGEILTPLPSDFPLPVVCVQHISEGFLQGLVDWLASQCQMKVMIAEPGKFPLPGTIYFPQEGTQLKFDRKGRFIASAEPPLNGHRPSITVTMRSVADCYGGAAASILLTGMGKDGAEGMLAIAAAGGVTIAQDEESSIVFGMPKQAIALGAARYIMPLDGIAYALILLQKGNRL